MQRRMKVIIGATALAGAAVLGTGVAIAESTDGDDRPIQGEARNKAEAAALQHTQGGRVTETEMGDDGAAYEVEVLKDDKSQVEVQLDENFKVIGEELDDDSTEDDSDDDD